MSNPPYKPRTWGFRFSASDSLVIAIFAAATIGLQRLGNPLSWILLIVAGHFFLFCNIFRIRRSFEYIWAGIFIANIAAWLLLDRLDWIRVLSIQLPLTTWLVTKEIRSRRYHGVFAKGTNPNLNEYLEGKIP